MALVCMGFPMYAVLRQDWLGERWILSLFLCNKAYNNTKSPIIKETDGRNVDLFGGGISIILQGI